MCILNSSAVFFSKLSYQLAQSAVWILGMQLEIIKYVGLIRWWILVLSSLIAKSSVRPLGDGIGKILNTSCSICTTCSRILVVPEMGKYRMLKMIEDCNTKHNIHRDIIERNNTCTLYNVQCACTVYMHIVQCTLYTGD